MARSCLSLALGSVAALVLFSGCQKPDAAKEASFVKIGTTKADLFGLPGEYRALHMRLEKRLERPVRFVAQPDGPAIAAQLEQGNLAYAFLSAAEYAAIENPERMTPLASGVNSLGRTSRKALIVARTNSSIQKIAECKGKRFAFGGYRDPLTDFAARRTIEEAGLPVKDLWPELIPPPPIAMEGRLYLRDDVAKTIANDPTVEVGVVDEVFYARLPEQGGNFITGPSRDQLRVIGETPLVPEVLVVAGPSADPQLTALLKDELLNAVKDDETACRQLGLVGFAAPDRAAYDVMRSILPPAK